ncbi:hypothetical protein [Halalkalibacter krulwichiae]|uniref:Uncharacterized protein n=1 Tax=Halalkalibacter krulwichiae TaxID=199441 RepID=A0A1X9MIX5_9BACI|nr:hypothetical protein [Halalkalibacter krulwichiae]ARK32650.1 hypothetical protein BkAM31D_23900 [Halalkalibacter krulwichiae]
MKRFFHYFISTVLIGAIIYYGFLFHKHLEEQAAITYHVSTLVVYSILFPILLGMLLRLPRLIREIRQSKKWQLNWAKLVAVGLPSLYVTIAPVLYFSAVGPYFPFTVQLLQIGDRSMLVAGMVFGYVVMDSLKES